MAKLILIVDDSRTMRDMLTFTLKSIGFKVVAAEDGLDGLSKARIEKFDLVITDIYMPKMDGHELIRCLRMEEQYKYIPILVVTTENSTTMKNKAKYAGATGWIEKPFNPDKLEIIIKKVI